MTIVIDMSLSPEWEQVLAAAGLSAIHWSRVGPGNAPDQEILLWARVSGTIVFTHDLDFGALLAFSREKQPSVVQIRSQEVTPTAMGDLVIATFQQFAELLVQGALITIDPEKTRVRILPL